MSRLGRGDEAYHYTDGSHRWTSPPNIAQAVWEAGLRAHLAQHLVDMGGLSTRRPATRRVPRPRTR